MLSGWRMLFERSGSGPSAAHRIRAATHPATHARVVLLSPFILRTRPSKPRHFLRPTITQRSAAPNQ
jgi:hypothetical protein